MRDISVVIALLCASFGAFVLTYTARAFKDVHKIMWRVTMATNIALALCWGLTVWMWFSV